MAMLCLINFPEFSESKEILKIGRSEVCGWEGALGAKGRTYKSSLSVNMYIQKTSYNFVVLIINLINFLRYFAPLIPKKISYSNPFCQFSKFKMLKSLAKKSFCSLKGESTRNYLTRSLQGSQRGKF